MAQQADLQVGEFIWTGGDVHCYLNHQAQAQLQLTRQPYPLPTLSINRKPDSLFGYRYDDFVINDYQAHDAIKAPISI